VKDEEERDTCNADFFEQIGLERRVPNFEAAKKDI